MFGTVPRRNQRFRRHCCRSPMKSLFRMRKLLSHQISLILSFISSRRMNSHLTRPLAAQAVILIDES